MTQEQSLNEKFLKTTEESYNIWVKVGGTSRTPAKLKPLHGTIAKDIERMLGDNYIAFSIGHGDEKEININGATHGKNADIAIQDKRTKKFVAIIEVKYVMQNYKQNAVNYFEGMRGATENIRLSGIPCFQVFIAPDRLPYFSNVKGKGKIIKHWEDFSGKNAEKYIRMSSFNPDKVFGVPDSTLLYITHLANGIDEQTVTTHKEYLNFYRNNTPKMELSKKEFTGFNPKGAVIHNDYEKFLKKVCEIITSEKYAGFDINQYKI
jgi:hypothetical protein